MIELSGQQQLIVGLPLEPFSVTACAGSGKTQTAVHRLAEMRKKLEDNHGLIALLSFSNVAVDTFRRDYLTLMRTAKAGRRSHAVEIDTVDGFIVCNILRPHAHRIMGAARTPFLVDGSEPFLRGFKVFDGSRPHLTSDLAINLESGALKFTVGKNDVEIASAQAVAALAKLGKTGAYTHDSARYWVLRTLKEEPFVLRALARRYPHVLVDEAQDIGPLHQAILELMVSAGTRLSLIGDPNQGIYEFQGANGAFLAQYGDRPGILSKELTVNYRSVPLILGVANKLSGRADTADRPEPSTVNGAFYIPFKKAEKGKALGAFESMIATAGLATKDGVVLCRSADWAAEWSGGEEGQGQGIVRAFAEAVIFRDKLKDMRKAYELTCRGIVGLLASQHGDLASKLTRANPTADLVRLRRAIWSFARDPDAGLPAGTLLADTEWHPLMSTRVKAFIETLVRECGVSAGENLGQKLAKKALDNRPLIQLPDLAQPTVPAFRVSTVHKVKGESLEAVMYVANKDQVKQLLAGTGTEVGRIGYVAVTRAKNLFVLAVPDGCLAELEDELVANGFRRPGT